MSAESIALIDNLGEWFISVGTFLFGVFVTFSATRTLGILHKNRENWNCGNLTFRESRIWVEGILVLSLMFILLQLEMIGWIYTRHVCDHYRIFWAWHALHIGALIVSNRILLFVRKSALGQCVHSHGGEDGED